MTMQSTSVNPEILELVRKHFPSIAEPELQEEIASVGKLMHFKAGRTIMDVGAYVRHVPLVVEGSVKVVREDEDGHELYLYYLQAGDACSMSFTCCMMNKQSHIRTVAEEDTTLIAIPIRQVDEWMTRYQSWKNFVMTTYDERMVELVRTIDSIAFRRMDERLLDYLRDKATVTGKSVVEATHQQIAYDLNASREAISRLLKQMEKQGMVKLGRNKIELV